MAGLVPAIQVLPRPGAAEARMPGPWAGHDDARRPQAPKRMSLIAA